MNGVREMRYRVLLVRPPGGWSPEHPGDVPARYDVLGWFDLERVSFKRLEAHVEELNTKINGDVWHVLEAIPKPTRPGRQLGCHALRRFQSLIAAGGPE